MGAMIFSPVNGFAGQVLLLSSFKIHVRLDNIYCICVCASPASFFDACVYQSSSGFGQNLPSMNVQWTQAGRSFSFVKSSGVNFVKFAFSASALAFGH